MAAPRKEALRLVTACLAAFALVEYTVIAVLVQPLPSTRFDWIVATVYIAPMATAFLLWLIVLIVRITYDVLTFIRWVWRWITKNPQHPQYPDPPTYAPETPSFTTASAASPSSSCGWPSVGSSYISPPGRRSYHDGP